MPKSQVGRELRRREHQLVRRAPDNDDGDNDGDDDDGDDDDVVDDDDDDGDGNEEREGNSSVQHSEA